MRFVGVCIVERRGMKSDAGRGLCDHYSWCGSGVHHFMRLLLFTPNWFWVGGNRGRNRRWSPCLWNLSQQWLVEGGASTASLRVEPSRMATFFWVKHIHSSEISTSCSCSFVMWVLLGWEPELGTRVGRKDLFWRSHLSRVAALISLIKSAWWEMMHSVRWINVPFPSPLSVREKMNEPSVIGVKDAGIWHCE